MTAGTCVALRHCARRNTLTVIPVGVQSASVNDDLGSVANAGCAHVAFRRPRSRRRARPKRHDLPSESVVFHLRGVANSMCTDMAAHEFPSTFLLFDKQKLLVLCSVSKGTRSARMRRVVVLTRVFNVLAKYLQTATRQSRLNFWFKPRQRSHRRMPSPSSSKPTHRTRASPPSSKNLPRKIDY